MCNRTSLVCLRLISALSALSAGNDDASSRSFTPMTQINADENDVVVVLDKNEYFYRMHKRFLLLIFLFPSLFFAQTKLVLTHADTLKGTYGPARSWWDVTHYDLTVEFNLADSTISG